MKETIRFDFTRLTAAAVGEENGVTDSEISSMRGRCGEAVVRLKARKESGELGFFRLPADDALARRVSEMADEIASAFDNFVVLGIGGSALGNIALQTALCHPYHNLLNREGRGGRPRMFFPDNVDPDRFHALLDLLDLRKTCFNVITKSGSTAETMAQFLIVRDRLRNALGPEEASRRIVTTTDPEKGSLRAIAKEERYVTLPVPSNVGGRFSVLSAVGLLSAAVSGVEVGALLAGARSADASCWDPDPEKNPALMGALLQFLLEREKGKRILVMMPYSHRLKDFADWFRQLWAESLGKAIDREGTPVGSGQTPVKALGATDQHSQIQLYMEGPNDKCVLFLFAEAYDREVPIPASFDAMEGVRYLGGHGLGELLRVEGRATEAALTEAGRPTAALILPRVTPFTVGKLVYLLEMQTAYAGELYKVNAFNQPGVEAGKAFTYGMMGRPGYEAKRREVEAARDLGREASIAF